MHKPLTLLVLLACSRASLATDVTLSVGYMYNSDFEVASASDQPPTVAPGTGEPGEDVPLEGAAGFNLAVDFVYANQPNQRIGLFISYEQTRFDANAGLSDPDMDVTHVHFTAMSYYPQGNLEPFVMAGIGAGFFSPRDSTLKDEVMLSAQVAAGANYRLGEHLLLRFDARWIPTFFNGSSTVFCSGGCTVAVRSDTYSQAQANIGLMYRF